MNHMTFPEHLQRLRQGRNLTQKEVAIEIGISLPSYQRYEYGSREPQMSTLVAIADFYGISLDELVCRSSNKE